MRNASQEPSFIEPGKVIGGCKIVRRIGRGGMGEVYLAEHLALQKSVAVKVLPPDWASDEMVQRFLKEARMCARIEHPHVISIYDVGQEDGFYFITMQYVDGKNLAELLEASHGAIPWDAALKVIRAAVRGLDAVHRLGLVHRDIKPANIMLASDARVLLMDFGLVRDESNSDLTRTGTIMGTPSYMPPEQCLGKVADARSDIYSLGATLYTLLTAKIPFHGTTTEVLAQIVKGESPPPADRINPSVPRQVSELVAKAMAPEPRQRFADARSMSRALSNALQTCAAAPRTPVNLPDTVSLGSAIAPIDTIPELELLGELESTNPWPEMANAPWWLFGGAALILLLLVGLVLNVAMSGAFGSRRPSIVADMVHVERGMVRMGNSEAQVRQYLGPVAESAADLENLVGFIAESPRSTQVVEEFWIDKYEVTNAQYAKFLKATGRRPPIDWSGTDPPVGKANFPVVNVRYSDAEAYARWAGKKLPTAEQWVRAFRGDTEDLFPWGNDYDPSRVNVRENSSFPSTSDVTQTPLDVSRLGVHNLVGNVREFIRGTATYHGNQGHWSKGSDFGSDGSFYGNGSMSFFTTPDWTDDQFGFRCVYEP